MKSQLELSLEKLARTEVTQPYNINEPTLRTKTPAYALPPRRFRPVPTGGGTRAEGFRAMRGSPTGRLKKTRARTGTTRVNMAQMGKGHAAKTQILQKGSGGTAVGLQKVDRGARQAGTVINKGEPARTKVGPKTIPTRKSGLRRVVRDRASAPSQSRATSRVTSATRVMPEGTTKITKKPMGRVGKWLSRHGGKALGVAGLLGAGALIGRKLSKRSDD